jgi:hypothetical protein
MTNPAMHGCGRKALKLIGKSACHLALPCSMSEDQFVAYSHNPPTPEQGLDFIPPRPTEATRTAGQGNLQSPMIRPKIPATSNLRNVSASSPNHTLHAANATFRRLNPAAPYQLIQGSLFLVVGLWGQQLTSHVNTY